MEGQFTSQHKFQCILDSDLRILLVELLKQFNHVLLIEEGPQSLRRLLVERHHYIGLLEVLELTLHHIDNVVYLIFHEYFNVSVLIELSFILQHVHT